MKYQKLNPSAPRNQEPSVQVGVEGSWSDDGMENVIRADSDDEGGDERTESVVPFVDQAGRVKTFLRIDHYCYRGKDDSPLLALNMEEYYSLVKVVKKPRHWNVGNPQRGRRQNARYQFHTGHPLHETHLQQVRSKALVIVLAGFNPPNSPGSMPNRELEPSQYTRWLKKANIFGAFYGTFLVPWNFDDIRPVYNWETFRDYVQARLKNPNYKMRHFLKARRLRYVNNVLNNLRSSSKC
jgi:hypothetical protein